MPFVLAQQEGWGKFNFEIHDNFANLRDGVNHKGTVAPSDAFMWEIFTTKKYYDNGEIKQIGQIYTPWSSWVISASTDLTENAEGREELAKLAKAINEGIVYFNSHHDEAVNWISSNLDYSAEDAKAWLSTVRFSHDVSKVDIDLVIKKTVEILETAEVLSKDAHSKTYVKSIQE
jgi:hypothetical protein